MPQDLIIGAKTGGSSNLLRINDTSRRFSFRDVDGSWKEAASVDFAIFEKPDEVSRFLVLELSANADYSPAATLNSQTDQTNFIYYDGAAWSAFPAGGISPTALGTLVAFNFAAVAKNLGGQIFFRFWWFDGQTTTEKKASIFPAMSLANSGASSAAEVETATDSVAGIARAATQTEVDDGTAGFIFVTPATLNAKKFAASKITGLATVATSGDYNDLINKYELPAASASARGGVKIGSNINLTSGDVISVASASTSSAGVVQLASATEVTAGTVDNKAVTPAGLKVELDKKANSADLKAVALSGSYNDLTDKPEIPEVVAASTTAAGIVRLATAEEAAGELATIAVTPAGLNSVLSGYYTSTEIDNKLSVVIRYKGVKATEAELPSSENEIGDFWLVSEDSSEYVWNGTAWEKFGATISLDGYLTTEAASQTYVAKTQLATATSVGIVQIGQNININSGIISVASASVSTSGAVQLASTAEVTAGSNNFKAVTPAGLKVELDKKANLNALATVATSGDYNDLSNKYELPAATSTTIGGVKPGGNLTVTADGTLNFTGFGAQSSDGSSLSSEIKVLKAGSGTQFSYNSGVLTIGLDSSVTGGLTAVTHDSTLTGQGTSSDPLKVNVVTTVSASTDASDDKIPTELAVRNAIDSQKVTKLVLQRGASEKSLYPKIAFSASADFSSASEFDFSSSDFARSSARVFNGTGWISFPAGGLDASYDNREVVIDVATLLGDSMPQLPFYFRFCWIEAGGTASDYKSSIFPAAPSFPPAADAVDEERLLPIGGAKGNVLKIDSTGKATWAEGIDEARLVPTGGGAGKVLGFQDEADRGNGNDVKLLLQNALTDSATGNAAPASVTAQGVTLTAENDLEFGGNDSHITAVLPVSEIFAADKEWTIDFWFNPTANSSEWNYVLTENNGDWGSHSLGLTWNADDQKLEQDTGGYVASAIKAPTWPNNSIACAAGQWHFVAVEKQKTENGWSLNYYLNGSPWLKVAFTSSFAPFDSTTPFWFGGNTSDGGRWFKGKANKLRVTIGARYGGKAFAVPDRLTDYAAPAGQPVWVDGIDRSRLLPENPATGAIPYYKADAGSGEWGTVRINGVTPDEDGVITIENVDKSRLLPPPENYDLTNNGWLIGLSVTNPSARPEYLCLYTLDSLIGDVPVDVTGKTTVVDVGAPLNVVEDSGAFEGKAMCRSLSRADNYLKINMPQISGPFTIDVRFKAGNGHPGMGGNGTEYGPGGSLVNTPGGQLGYFLGGDNNSQIYFYALAYNDTSSSGSKKWKSFNTQDWCWMRICRNNSALYVFMNGEKVAQTTHGTALVTIPEGAWKFLPSYLDSDVLIDEVLITNTCMATNDYIVPIKSYGQLLREWQLYQDIDRSRLLPDNPSDYDLAIYRTFPAESAPQNLTSATSDPNWEVTWSGAYSGRVGWQAFDSDQSTVWCTYSAAVGDWLCWEYKGTEGKVLLRRYSIAKGSGNGDCPTGWKIQGSNDGVIWADLDEQTGQSFPDNNAKEYTIPNNSTPYKFHRFYLLSWNTSNMIGTFKAWSWINSTDECNRWVTVDIADLQGTSENEITLVRPVSDQSLFPIIEASADVGFTSVQTINARTVANDRTKIKVFNGSAFADFPDSGLGTPYDEQSIVIDVSGFIAALGDSFYVRYKWESSDGTASDYKAAKFPFSVAQTPVSSTGGGSGNVTYQTFAIPAQASWTADPDDSTRMYVSVASGRCSCIVYDESGTEVGIEVQYVSSANETRLVIPSDIAGGTITTGWTCRYAQISEN